MGDWFRDRRLGATLNWVRKQIMTELKKSHSELFPWSMLPPTASTLQHQVEAVGLRHAFQVQTQPFTPCHPPTYAHEVEPDNTISAIAEAIDTLASYKTEPPAKRFGTKIQNDNKTDTATKADKPVNSGTKTEPVIQTENDTWLQPALFWEYGLDAVLPYVQLADASKDMIKAPLAWQRLKGTPKSVRLGMQWLNLNNIDFVWGEDEHFHEYQIELLGQDSGDDPSRLARQHEQEKSPTRLHQHQPLAPLRQSGAVYDQSLQNIAEILKLCSPVRAQCTRVFRRPAKVVDRQPIKLSDSNSDFGQILSDFDGVLHQKSGLRVSFHDVYETWLSLYAALDTASENKIVQEKPKPKPKEKEKQEYTPTLAAPVAIQSRYFTFERDVHWQVQVNGGQQTSYYAQSVNIPVQRQWYGTWAEASWDAAREVLGSRQTKQITHRVEGEIAPKQLNTAIGVDVQSLTWSVQVAVVKHRDVAQAVDLPAQKQWYGGWDNIGWSEPRSIYGSRRHRCVVVDAKVDLSMRSHQCIEGVDVNHIVWQPTVQATRSMSISQTLIRACQHQWYGCWADTSWNTARDVLGSRQTKQITHVVDAEVQSQQMDTAIGVDVQSLTWSVQVAVVKHRDVAQAVDLPAQKQWYGGWDNIGWSEARSIYGSRRHRGVAVDARVALSICSHQCIEGVDVNRILWQPTVQATRSMSISQTLIRACQHQWYGCWADTSWNTARDVLGSRQIKRLTHAVDAEVQSQQMDTAIGVDVQCLRWDVAPSSSNPERQWVQILHLPHQRQWYGRWQDAQWNDGWEVIGSDHAQSSDRGTS
jgi:hypothetical protein